MSATRKKIAKYFNENELVYRRGLTVKEIGVELIESALTSIRADWETRPDAEAIKETIDAYAEKLANNFVLTLRNPTNLLARATKETSYVHIGYYNDIADIKELSRKSADEILDYYKHGYGHFYEDDAREPDTELIKEDEAEAIKKGDVKFTSDGKFAIYDTSDEGFAEAYRDSEDGDDSDCYIDIYELRTVIN